MNIYFFFAAIFLSFQAIASAQIPVEIRSADNNAATRVLINAMARMVNNHPAYAVTNDTTVARGVINVAAVTNGGVTAYSATLELRPPSGNLGIAVRSNVGFVDADDLASGFVENMVMIQRLFNALLVEDHMVDKMGFLTGPINGSYMQREDYNELARRMKAIQRAMNQR